MWLYQHESQTDWTPPGTYEGDADYTWDRIAVDKYCGDRAHGFICTRSPGHKGWHVAHIGTGDAIARWIDCESGCAPGYNGREMYVCLTHRESAPEPVTVPEVKAEDVFTISGDDAPPF